MLSANNITAIELVDEMPVAETFSYIFFFEVLGYLENPSIFLESLKGQVQKGGKVIFSFTNIRHQGDAEKYSGNMACFSRQEVLEILKNAGYKAEIFINYGYPLSNLLRPLLHRHYKKRNKSGKQDTVENSGLVYSDSGFQWGSLLINRFTVFPFLLLQRLFRNTDLGTGYIVVASRLDD